MVARAYRQIVRRMRCARPAYAWSGPVQRGSRVSRKRLSWFEVPAARSIPASFLEALNDALDESGKYARADECCALMKRLLDAYAGADSGRERSTQRTCSPDQSAAVVIVDERLSSPDPFACSRRDRRAAFRRLLQAAKDTHPGQTLWIVRSGDRGSGPWLSGTVLAQSSDACLTTHDGSFHALLPVVQHVYTLGATEGLYALLRGATVHVFGKPFYAGWGLTDDRQPQCGRRSSPTREAFFHAVFVRLAHYLDPLTHREGTLDAVVASMELQNEVARRYGDIRSIAACGFQWWKCPFIKPFLESGATKKISWVRNPSGAVADFHIATWGARELRHSRGTAPRLFIEDGFLHSCGLGSDLSAPYSQVIDRTGIYFDPHRPGDLALLLNETVFDDAELARARALRTSIVAAGLTKYNLGRRRPTWTAPAGAQVVLVAGQVADDASVRFGCPGIRTSEALLHEVRKRRPAAWLVYRPHPDVLAGNRGGLIGDPGLDGVVDVVDTTADIVSLIDAADEVHTLTSLAGFDALLRGKEVFTYGMPFYAGWGLTHDAISGIPARIRPLTLDMLTAGVLLRYPLYWDWELGRFTTPEAIVYRLRAQAQRSRFAMQPMALRAIRKAWRWSRNVAIHLAQDGITGLRGSPARFP
ncbi:capsular polysaccharide export protein, LipB/KpsS family [Burkholderia sola]|uniref:capsular polysaccharide export protein, LipB/KpsS family n=1 Tax=Burkholderia sola TaxID=2843302 RepID=UPI003B8A814C|nr:capsular biosynthesis protein [Burkholderia sola]